MKSSSPKRHPPVPTPPISLVNLLAGVLCRLELDLPILAVSLEAEHLLIIFAGGRQERFPLKAELASILENINQPVDQDGYLRLAMAALGHDRLSPPDWTPNPEPSSTPQPVARSPTCGQKRRTP